MLLPTAVCVASWFDTELTLSACTGTDFVCLICWYKTDRQNVDWSDLHLYHSVAKQSTSLGIVCAGLIEGDNDVCGLQQSTSLTADC